MFNSDVIIMVRSGTPDFLTVPLLCVSSRPALVERKPPELSTLNDGYQIRI